MSSTEMADANEGNPSGDQLQSATVQQSPAALVSTQASDNAAAPTGINKVPSELIQMVMRAGCLQDRLDPTQTDMMSICTAVCLGLTCQRFWRDFKDCFLEGKNQPIRLDCFIWVASPDKSDPKRRKKCYLARLLPEWMGTGAYRYTQFGGGGGVRTNPSSSEEWFIYLSRSAYSDGPESGRWLDLASRYQAFLDLRCNLSTAILPHPRGLGDDWYRVAAGALQQEVSTWPVSMADWSLAQKYLWRLYDRSDLARHVQFEMRDMVSGLPKLPYLEMRRRVLLLYREATAYGVQDENEQRNTCEGMTEPNGQTRDKDTNYEDEIEALCQMIEQLHIHDPDD